MRCTKHRSDNLRLRQGAAAKAQYWRCVRTLTVDKIADIKLSVEYNSLGAASIAALQSIPDSCQFPAAAVAAGALLYGRDSNQLSETDNSAIEGTRNMDPFLFVITNTERAVRLYTTIAAEAHSCQTILAPRITTHLFKLRKTGEAQAVHDKFTSRHHVYNVTMDSRVHTVHLRVPDAGAVNQSRFPDDEVLCTCGAPGIERMPCGHMLAVADMASFSRVLLVPYDLTTAAWVAQYPPVDVFAPSYSSVLSSSVPRDLKVKMPVSAPPKRGRPAKRRMRGVMEKISKKSRRNDGR